MRLRHLLCFLSVAGLLLVVGCSDETRDQTREAAESAAEDADEFVDSSSAQAIAAALQASIEADERYEDEGPRSVAVLQENIDDLPGEPEVVGVDDTDGDGLEDDGQVEVRVDDDAACLSLGEIGEGIDISDDACAAS
jgi:hypothetical protein